MFVDRSQMLSGMSYVIATYVMSDTIIVINQRSLKYVPQIWTYVSSNQSIIASFISPITFSLIFWVTEGDGERKCKFQTQIESNDAHICQWVSVLLQPNTWNRFNSNLHSTILLCVCYTAYKINLVDSIIAMMMTNKRHFRIVYVMKMCRNRSLMFHINLIRRKKKRWNINGKITPNRVYICQTIRQRTLKKKNCSSNGGTCKNYFIDLSIFNFEERKNA